MSVPAEDTAAGIYKLLVENLKVTVGSLTDKETINLKNYLNVLKSRDKSLYEGLGFDFTAGVIRVTKFSDRVEIMLEAPKPTKKFTIVKTEVFNKTE
jgi:hypothetical protein